MADFVLNERQKHMMIRIMGFDLDSTLPEPIDISILKHLLSPKFPTLISV